MKFEVSCVVFFFKGGCAISKNTYLKAAAKLVSGKEAYGGQKQPSNIENRKCSFVQCLFDRENTKLLEFTDFYLDVTNGPTDP